MRTGRLPVFPSDEAISNAMGFRVPIEFIRSLRISYEHCSGTWESFCEFFGPMCWSWTGPVFKAFRSGLKIDDGRYCNFPPEFVPIAHMGVDGAGWGFLVHTPEVPLDQLPVVHYCPMDSDPPSLSGKDVIQAIRTAMECSLESRSENPELFENDSAAWELMVNVARNSLGINAELPRAGDKEAGMARAFVPPGYRYLPSADWVGVCAPNDSIDASVILPQHCDGDTLHRLASPDRIRSLLGEGKPASALLLAREFVWHNCYVSPARDEYFQFMLRAYRDLGRPLHADNLAVQIRKP